jgi:hypothetical protein
MLGLQDAMEIPEHHPGLLERYSENMQDDTVSTEILGLTSLEQDKKC